MPAPSLKALARKHGVRVSRMEELWTQAKSIARDNGFRESDGDSFYAYTMGIVKRMVGASKEAAAAVTGPRAGRKDRHAAAMSKALAGFVRDYKSLLSEPFIAAASTESARLTALTASAPKETTTMHTFKHDSGSTIDVSADGRITLTVAGGLEINLTSTEAAAVTVKTAPEVAAKPDPAALAARFASRAAEHAKRATPAPTPAAESADDDEQEMWLGIAGTIMDRLTESEGGMSAADLFADIDLDDEDRKALVDAMVKNGLIAQGDGDTWMAC